MNRKLEHLHPDRVFYYFENLSQIPHGSYNTRDICDYCASIAQKNNCEITRDNLNNLIITKPATKGYEDAKPIIIQGHLDMVCEKTADSSHDFKKDPLNLFVQGDLVGAKDTTLGADDGIAIAYGLALIESTQIAHPKLYLVFTVDEEVGMDGAQAIDLSSIADAGYLINLDSGEDGVFTVGCAGGISVNFTIPLTKKEITGMSFQLKVNGLKGGHSGIEINRFGGNANVILGGVLRDIKTPYSLVNIQGGTKDNVIPTNAEAQIIINSKDKVHFISEIENYAAILKATYGDRDPEIRLTAIQKGEATIETIDEKILNKIIFLLSNCPNGVVRMEAFDSKMVETSLNLGILKQDNNTLQLGFSLRSSKAAAKQLLLNKICSFANHLGVKYEIEGDYPPWEYKKESQLRDTMESIYKEMKGVSPKVTTIHAGLECGILLSKLPHLDAISIGPNSLNIHSANERLSISSTAFIWEFLKKILSKINSN